MQLTAQQLIRMALSDCTPASALMNLVAARKITYETARKAWNSTGVYFNLAECAEMEGEYQKYHDI